MKAYKREDGSLALFRPEQNARRFNESARRMAMPELPEELFLESIRQLVGKDRDWVHAIPLRLAIPAPFHVRFRSLSRRALARQYKYILIASPVGPYFKGGAKVKIWVSRNYTRAAPGGTGAAKTGGNYAASLVPQAEGIENGCDQVVFLDAVEKKWVEELGGMNLFFVFDDGTVITPPLTGTILPGITRDSLIQLLREEGLQVREEPYSIDQWRADATKGRLLETMACGTAAVVTPVGTVLGPDGEFTIGSGGIGQMTNKIRERLVGIQKGTVDDSHGWTLRLTDQKRGRTRKRRVKVSLGRKTMIATPASAIAPPMIRRSPIASPVSHAPNRIVRIGVNNVRGTIMFASNSCISR